LNLLVLFSGSEVSFTCNRIWFSAWWSYINCVDCFSKFAFLPWKWSKQC
jgi:hypothetical protein